MNFINQEKCLIMGTLLGDAHMQKRGNSYRLKIAHCIEHKAYVLWKYEKLKRLCPTTKAPKIVMDNKGNKTVEFYTSSSIMYKEIYNLFYKQIPTPSNNPNNKGRFVKCITPELIQNLPVDALLLATFFMDDGSVRNDCYAGKLATQGFTKAESHLLAQYLKKYDIGSQVVVHSKNKKQYYLTIPAKSFGVLVKHIEPIVNEIPIMLYKLNATHKPRND